MQSFDFIAEKKSNFAKFLRSKLPKAFDSYITKLEFAPTSLFILYIQNDFIQMEDEIDLYIDKLLQEHECKRTDFNEEDLVKFKRYLKMFIELCQK